MKKIFTLLILLLLLPVTALAADEHDSHSNNWTEFTAGTTTLSGGSYYLSGDVAYTGTQSITVSGEVTLCLNGHEMDLKGQHISVDSGASLTLCDCSTGGVLTGGSGAKGGGVFVDGSGTFTLTGGNIAGNTANAGGGVYVNKGGTFTMEGGSIYNNKATVGGGGGVMVYEGSFTLSGGSITGNATNTNTNGFGGGVCLYGTFYLSGDAIIQNNTKAGTTDNLYLGWQTINITGPLGKNARIGVTAENVPRSFISGWSNNMAGKDPADYFSSDGDACGIGLNTAGDVVLGNLCTTITLNPNGGTLPEYSLVAGAALPIPTKTGYTFAGWYENPEFSGNPVTDIPTDSTGELTFYAKWTVNTYTVKFDSTGGDGSMDDQTFIYGVAQNLTKNTFTRTGYTFTGWNTQADGNGTSYADGVDGSQMPADNGSTVILYAQWTINTYKITAQVANGCEGMGEVIGGDTYKYGTTVTLTATASEGYRFVDWVEGDQTVSTDATYIFTATGDRTLTARFEKLYTVTVSPAEGGTATADKTTAAAGETITLTATPSSGYYFVEWKVVSGTVSIQNNKFTMPAGDVKVQAVFGLSVTNITLDKTELPLYIGDSETLTATIEPGDATNKTVTWSSDKPGVAAVDASGNVTAVAAGNATITAMADGGKTATCVVQVREYVEVEASGSTNLSFTTDRDKFTLTAVVKAEGNVLTPTENSWKWSVANEDVVERVTLRSKAVSYSTSRQAFTIKGTGTTTITATYDDGTYRGLVEFKVSISKPTPPDPISYYNIYVEDVCDGVEVSTSKNVVREGGSVSVYVKKDTVNYTFDNFKVYYKRSYYGTWDELKEGTQPGEYPIKNIWTHIYIKAEGAEEKEDPTGIEQVEGVKVYTKDGSLYVQTPQREQVIIVSMSGAIVKNEEQIGLKQYHGLQPGIYIVRVGDRAYKVRLN